MRSTVLRLLIRALLPLALTFCTSLAEADELELPSGWLAGGPAVEESDAATEPACCALGTFHPCCAGERSLRRSRPHQVKELVAVDVNALPVVSLRGCGKVDADEPLPPAEQLASDYGLRVFIEGRGGSLDTARNSDSVRLLPKGDAGGIYGANTGYWSPGDRGTFSTLGSFTDYGVSYDFGSPWKRVDQLIFNAVDRQSGELRFRFFDGSYDIRTGKVGARCAYSAPLAPLIDRWVYGFVGERDGQRELHVVMPRGRDLLGTGLDTFITFDPLFGHHILPLDRASAVATKASTFNWRHVEPSLSGSTYFGMISVHVTPGATDDVSIIVAREQDRNRR